MFEIMDMRVCGSMNLCQTLAGTEAHVSARAHYYMAVETVFMLSLMVRIALDFNNVMSHASIL
jgi:hypothetical protein